LRDHLEDLGVKVKDEDLGITTTKNKSQLNQGIKKPVGKVDMN
jgi:hypothetical protein